MNGGNDSAKSLGQSLGATPSTPDRTHSVSTSDRYFAQRLRVLCALATAPVSPRPVSTGLDHFRTFVVENYPLASGQQMLGQTSTQRRWFTWAEVDANTA